MDYSGELAQQFNEQLATERTEQAARFLCALPEFPPNVERASLTMFYDDGGRLEVDISPKRSVRRPWWKRILKHAQ